MPRSGVLVVLVFVAVFVVVSQDGPDLAPVVSAPLDNGLATALPMGEIDVPITHFGDHGWLERTITMESDFASAQLTEVVVELRFAWTGDVGHVRVVGSYPADRSEVVITDEVRFGADLAASIGHFQRMFDELRDSGGSVEVSNGATVARQRILTPDGEVEDVWRIGVGDPEW
jgi:hypothetical protein